MPQSWLAGPLHSAVMWGCCSEAAAHPINERLQQAIQVQALGLISNRKLVQK